MNLEITFDFIERKKYGKIPVALSLRSSSPRSTPDLIAPQALTTALDSGRCHLQIVIVAKFALSKSRHFLWRVLCPVHEDSCAQAFLWIDIVTHGDIRK